MSLQDLPVFDPNANISARNLYDQPRCTTPLFGLLGVGNAERVFEGYVKAAYWLYQRVDPECPRDKRIDACRPPPRVADLICDNILPGVWLFVIVDVVCIALTATRWRKGAALLQILSYEQRNPVGRVERRRRSSF